MSRFNTAVVRLRPTGPEVVDGTAVVILTVVGLVGFSSSYGGFAFVVLGGLAVVVGVIVAHVGVRWPLPLPAIAGVALVVYAVVGGAVALPDRTLVGVVPTPQSVLYSLRMAVVGWKALITTSPPVGWTGDLMILPVFTGLVAGLAGLLLARQRSVPPATATGVAIPASERAEGPVRSVAAVAPPAVVLALGIATGTHLPVSVLGQGVGFAVLAVAWLAARERRRRPLLTNAPSATRIIALSAVMLLVASAAGFALSERLPLADRSPRQVWRQSVVPPFDPRQYPSPLAGYRRYVTAANRPGQADPVLFTVEGLPEGVPVRLATMDAYDGLVWQVSPTDPEAPSLDSSGSFQRVGTTLEPDFPGPTATVTVTIGAYRDVWIPNVGEVIELRFEGGAGGRQRDRRLSEQYRYNRSTDTGVSRLPLQDGDRYVMAVRLPELVENLEGEQVVPTVPRLGANVSVSEVTQKLVGADILAVNDTGRRLDLVRNLMTDFGTYSDGDLDSGQVRARAGHSAQRLVSFVSGYPKVPLIGNAEQYAASYALVFRELDRIPTRVVMGFVPPTASVDQPVEVRASQVEAWVEVPLADKGWVGIEPTPPRDQTALTTSSPQQPEPDYRTQNPPPPPVLDPEFDQPATASGDAQATDEDPGEEPGDDPLFPLPEVLRRWLITGGLVLSPLLTASLAVVIIAALKRRRRARRRGTGSGHERIANGWDELTDFSQDAGRPLPAATTRREAAAFVGRGLDLAVRADAAVWSGTEPDEATIEAYWEDLVAELESMRHSLGPAGRLKAAISVQSLKSERARRKEVAHRG